MIKKANKKTDMNYMFDDELLQVTDLHSFDTSKAIDMGNMFTRCYQAKKLDLSNFGTSNAIYMNEMFYNCESLSALNIDTFNTSKVEYMDSMFTSCRGLTSLDLSNFNTSKVINMQLMFAQCNNLDLSDCPLSHKSIISVIDGLSKIKKYEKQPRINLSKQTYHTLFKEDLRLIQRKRWIIQINK